MLFRLAADTSFNVETVLRQAAVIRMKNVISYGWRSIDGAEPKLSEADKSVVRENLVEALVVAPQVVRTQLGLCLRAIAQEDFPHSWPSLLPTIAASLSLERPERLYGALYSLRVLGTAARDSNPNHRGTCATRSRSVVSARSIQPRARPVRWQSRISSSSATRRGCPSPPSSKSRFRCSLRCCRWARCGRALHTRYGTCCTCCI